MPHRASAGSSITTKIGACSHPNIAELLEVWVVVQKPIHAGRHIVLVSRRKWEQLLPSEEQLHNHRRQAAQLGIRRESVVGIACSSRRRCSCRRIGELSRKRVQRWLRSNSTCYS